VSSLLLNKRLFINLTPFIPLSMIWICIPSMRGKVFIEEGLAPLSYLSPPSLIKGRGSGGFPEKSRFFWVLRGIGC
jgi:hypothetical protein